MPDEVMLMYDAQKGDQEMPAPTLRQVFDFTDPAQLTTAWLDKQLEASLTRP